MKKMFTVTTKTIVAGVVYVVFYVCKNSYRNS